MTRFPSSAQLFEDAVTLISSCIFFIIIYSFFLIRVILLFALIKTGFQRNYELFLLAIRLKFVLFLCLRSRAKT